MQRYTGWHIIIIHHFIKSCRQSMWNISGKGMEMGELSGFTSMMSAM